jgi:hypothetical protein
MRKHMRKRIRLLERRIAKLETSTAIDPTYDPRIPQQEFDPQRIWRQHSEDYAAGEADEYWHHRGYL